MDYKESIQNKLHINGEYQIYPNIADADLRLELSNICNDRCPFCPNSKMSRKRKKMDKQLAFRILREAGELGIKKAGLFMNGEPFVTPDLGEYVKYAKDSGIEYVFLTTNGGLANQENLMSVLNAGLDSIKFSINAGSQETYRLIHGQDDYEKVIEKLKFVHEYRKESGLRYNILSSFVMTKYTIAEVEMHKKRIEPYVDDLVFFHAQSFGGQMIDEVRQLYAAPSEAEQREQQIKTFMPGAAAVCPLVFNSLNVTCEGYLTLCCTEASNYLVVEDLNQMPLAKAWYSDRMADMRRRHINNQLEGTQCYLCKNNCQAQVMPLNQELYEKSRIKNI